MKYQFDNSHLSKDRREFYNTEILALLKSGQQVEAETVFNLYTGLGGLHGLKYVDFDSFKEYTDAKKEIEIGQFFTPPPLCEKIIESLRPEPKHKICDMTCGSGNFFNSLPVESNAYGCELEPNAAKVAKFLYPDASIIEGDFVSVQFPTKFDMIVGNPPFNLMTPQGVSQFVYMQKCADYLLPGRVLCFLAPKTFLEDEYLNSRKRLEINREFNFICQAEIDRSYFDVDLDIKVMYFMKNAQGWPPKYYSNTYVPFNPSDIYEQHIKPIHEFLKGNAHAKLVKMQMLSEAKRCVNFPSGVSLTWEQADRLRKYTYEFKRQPRLRKHNEAAAEKITLLANQQKPNDMSWRDWDKAKLKPDEVLKWMQKKIREQYKPPPQKYCKLVKKKYSIKYKAYSKAMADKQKEMSITDIILKDKPYSGKFADLIWRKKQAYKLQSTPMQKLERDEKLDNFLRAFRLHETDNGFASLFEDKETIQLNDKQLFDLGLAFQKPYAILAWQQGSGKSVAGMAWIRLVAPKVRNVFITAPSLAVQLTWKPRLKKFGFNFICVEKWSDFHKVKRGQIVLISFDMVRILQQRKHVKNFIKKQCAYSIALLVDESDELTNGSSGRTRAMLSCFRKAKYKLLTTGTTTRNNVNELYPQLELLYNNSINMLCESTHSYRPDDAGQLNRVPNGDSYMKPYHAFRGHALFRYCHCPQNTTVFGIQQDTQDIYNADVLKRLIDKTIITRTFDDVVGKRIYKIKTHHVVQGVEEHRLYAKIIEQFYSIVYNYFNSTGNARKERLLQLIRQITLLIQSTSIPHTFMDYESKEKPMKFYHIHDMIKGWPMDKVAIGTVMKEAAREYHDFLKFHFPQREVFYIDGEKSFAARKSIIAKFQATANGILVSTQQSLKSSVDIETCNKCILESLQWNIPKMSQYYFRFIRYNSKEEKEIHFVTYANTIEQNLLALLMTKEKLNEFVKNTEKVQQRSDIMNEYDVDTGILNQLIIKDYDDDGHMVLRWGNQTITNTARA